MSKLIKAVFINTEAQTVENIMIEPTLAAYYEKLGVSIITGAGYFPNNDWLIVDDEGLFNNNAEFFSIEGNPHGKLAGNGLIIGDDGDGGDTDALTRAEDLTITFYAPRIETPAQGNNGGIITESCGCRFNWNDKFYESRCADCDEEIGWDPDDSPERCWSYPG